MHPSNKRCRNFPGNCPFDQECWYVHEDKDDQGLSLDAFNCNLCDETFKGRDNFMVHKKKMHPLSIPACDKFKSKMCQRNAESCWFEHPMENKKKNTNCHSPTETKTKSEKSNADEEQVFCEAPQNAFPPDQITKMLDMVKQMCDKVQNMELKMEELMI